MRNIQHIRIAFHGFIIGCILFLATAFFYVTDPIFYIWREWNKMTMVTCLMLAANSAIFLSIGIMLAEKIMRKNSSKL